MAAVRWHRSLACAALASLALPSLVAVAAGSACGTDAVGVQACRQIEEARCRRAPACGISIDPPYHTGGSDVDECIRFYDDACLHGLTTGDTPSGTQLEACVAAINGAGTTGDGCSIVSAPEVAAPCSWLATTPITVDAADDADAGE
jgi:hypothetical protein